MRTKQVSKLDSFLITLVGMLVVATFACGPPVVRQLRHEPGKAAESAEQFARVALVEGDVQGAYELLWEDGKRRLSAAAFAEALADMNKKGRPTTVEATDYEPVFGQPSMMIFLHGKGGTEDFYNRFHMMGTQDTGYRVADFFKGSGPYPPSSIRRSLRLGRAAAELQLTADGVRHYRARADLGGVRTPQLNAALAGLG